MRLATRKLLDRTFSSMGFFSIALMAGALLVILLPIVIRGSKAFVFKGTIEHRRLLLERFDRGERTAVESEMADAAAARQPVYDMIASFKAKMDEDRELRREYRRPLNELEEFIGELLGPAPGEAMPVLVHKQYGQTRWDRAELKLQEILYEESWDYSDPTGMGKKVFTPRVEQFADSDLKALFPYLEKNAEAMLLPRRTLYWGFLFDKPLDSHMLGGIWPEMLGTIYLTIGAMLVALPLGVIAAIYFAEYARGGLVVSFLRTCVSTLAGVPSIVFGMFGLACFINSSFNVSETKSVLAGALTLGLLILPTVIRAAEEAIRSVPRSYREAALGLGSGRWHTVWTVVLPAALPGILTGVVISMGRAAGETAPIIFTAAVSVGRALSIGDVWTQPTPALSWNIYNLCTEHEAVDQIRHVQYGMVTTLVGIVLLLNTAAIYLRARISKKLRG